MIPHLPPFDIFRFSKSHLLDFGGICVQLTRLLSLQDSHCEFCLRNDKGIICFQIMVILCKNVRKTCRNSKKKFLYIVLFCKSILSKMTSTKTNKNKKWTPLPKTNFLRYTTLLLGPKRFVHSKGPKIALCLC